MRDTYPVYTYNYYDEIYKEITKIKRKYKKKIQHLELDYEKIVIKKMTKYQNCCYKILVRCFIKIIKLFPEIKTNSVSIFLHGSYSRRTNTLFSDIDFTFCYNNALRNLFIPIEEIIAITLIDIFGLDNRCKIHPIMNNFENYYKEEKCSNIIFNLGHLKITYDETCYKFMDIYNSVNSSRDINDLMKFYEEKLSTVQCSEFCYSFKQIYCNDIELDYSKKINELDKKLIKTVKKEDLIFMLDKIIVNLAKYSDDLNKFKEESISVSEFKRVIISQPNSVFYDLISILRRYLNRSFNYSKGINIQIFKEKEIAKLISKRKCKAVFDKFYTKNWYLNKIQSFFKVANIVVSHTNTINMQIKEIKEKYKAYFNANFNEVVESVNIFYDFLLDLTLNIKGNIWKNM